MAPIASLPDATRPKDIIERTFDVFSGPEGTMDMMCFVKFCESSKKVPASVADTIFSTVVQNVRDGMNLSEFKAALELCVNSGKPAGTCATPDRKCLTECSEDSPIVHRRTSKLVLIKPTRRATMGSVDFRGLSKKSSLGLENQDLNITVGLMPAWNDDLPERCRERLAELRQKREARKAEETNSTGASSASTGASDSAEEKAEPEQKKKCSSSFRWSPIDPADGSTGGQDSPVFRRAIRWCPVEVEDEDLQPKMNLKMLARRMTVT